MNKWDQWVVIVIIAYLEWNLKILISKKPMEYLRWKFKYQEKKRHLYLRRKEASRILLHTKLFKIFLIKRKYHKTKALSSKINLPPSLVLLLICFLWLINNNNIISQLKRKEKSLIRWVRRKIVWEIMMFKSTVGV